MSNDSTGEPTIEEMELIEKVTVKTYEFFYATLMKELLDLNIEPKVSLLGNCLTNLVGNIIEKMDNVDQELFLEDFKSNLDYWWKVNKTLGMH